MGTGKFSGNKWNLLPFSFWAQLCTCIINSKYTRGKSAFYTSWSTWISGFLVFRETFSVSLDILHNKIHSQFHITAANIWPLYNIGTLTIIFFSLLRSQPSHISQRFCWTLFPQSTCINCVLFPSAGAQPHIEELLDWSTALKLALSVDWHWQVSKIWKNVLVEINTTEQNLCFLVQKFSSIKCWPKVQLKPTIVNVMSTVLGGQLANSFWRSNFPSTLKSCLHYVWNAVIGEKLRTYKKVRWGVLPS